MKTILVLLDSLNREYLSCYNKETFAKTPCIESFAAESTIYENHFIGSAPCMPARRDILTGRLNFLERSWGPIEPFDVTLPEILKENDIYTHIITDHYHYAELGGEGYLQAFKTWCLFRGQEADPWISSVKEPEMIEHVGRMRPQYLLNRTQFKTEEDYPTPKTFKAACDWILDNKDADNYFLAVEAFDPHEPFDCPSSYLDLYKDDYTGPSYYWPEYAPFDGNEEQLKHIKNCYAGTLSMTDKWFGKFIETLKETNNFEDTLIIFTTDHGHLLGEHNYMAKNYMHQYNELAHIPLIVHYPAKQKAKKRVEGLTQTTDIMPSVLDYFKLPPCATSTGSSFLPLATGEKAKIRDYVLYGFFGKAINYCDGKYTYFKAPVNNNSPLFQYTAMPTAFRKYLRGKDIECGRYLTYTDYPVFKIAQQARNKESKYIDSDLLFDYPKDPKQLSSIEDKELISKYKELLITAMKAEGSPKEQYERVALYED